MPRFKNLPGKVRQQYPKGILNIRGNRKSISSSLGETSASHPVHMGSSRTLNEPHFLIPASASILPLMFRTKAAL